MITEISRRHPIPVNRGRDIHPRKTRSDGRHELISRLEPGESFFLESSIKAVSQVLWIARRMHPEREFTAQSRTEKGKGGVRIWRIQ